MAATDAPSTLGELRQAFLDGLKEVTGNTAINTVADRYLNIALQDMHQQERWWWQERRGTIVTKRPYSTGTVAVAQGATAVTGTTTAWNTVDAFGLANAGDGDKLVIGSTPDVYVITGTPGATSLVLGSRFTGSTVTASSYAAFQDEYALASDYESLADARYFDADRKIELIGPQEFYRRYTRNSVRQRIRAATIIELGPSGTPTARPRVVFGPAPDAPYTIPYRFYTVNLAVSSAGAAQVNMSATSDQPIVPIRWRMGIVYKALELWWSDRKDNPEQANLNLNRFGTLMLRARAAHNPTNDRPRLTPDMRSYAQGRRPWARVTSPRLTTGSRWDNLEE